MPFWSTFLFHLPLEAANLGFEIDKIHRYLVEQKNMTMQTAMQRMVKRN